MLQLITTAPCLTNILETLYSIADSIKLWTVQHLGQEIHSLTKTHIDHPSVKKTEQAEKVIKKMKHFCRTLQLGL